MGAGKEKVKRGGNPAKTVPNEETLFGKLFTKLLSSGDYVSLRDIQNNNTVSSKVCMMACCFFVCENEKCHKYRWFSARSWITVDLSKPGILRRYKQKCTKCSQPTWPRVPWGDLNGFAQAAIYVYTDRLEGRRPPPRSVRSGKKTSAGHQSQLCEKCGYGKRNCQAPRKEISI
ncbi:hypothetical protein CHUAL_003970 [Chamberlinius hualienensis]